MKYIVSLVCAAFIFSCQPEEEFINSINVEENKELLYGISPGSTESQLLESMGVPDKVQKWDCENCYAYQYGDSLSFVVQDPNGVSGAIKEIIQNPLIDENVAY